MDEGNFFNPKVIDVSFFSESKNTLSDLAHIANQDNLICTSKKRQ